MFVKYSKYSFYRIKNNYVYLFNQLNYAERYYDLDAEDFFKVLSKKTQALDDIVTKLSTVFDIEKDELHNDYLDFIHDLEQDGFVITGKSIDEIEQKQPKFSYKRFEEIKSNPNTDTIKKNNVKSIAEVDIKDELFVKNLYLEVTRRCNEKCLHCYIPQEQRSNGDYIPLEDAKKYINQAKELGIWELTITGGEPFLHPQINEILKYAREKDVIIAILSNLTVLNDSHMEVLKDIYPSHIQVSLYSLNPEVHDAVTDVKGSHQKTMAAIEKCYQNDIPIQLNCPLININKDDYIGVKEWGAKRGMKVNVDFFIMAQTDSNMENLKENTLKGIQYKEKYKQYLKYENINFSPNNHQIESEKHICGAGYGNLYISAKGKVYPCSVWQSYKLGDLTISNLKEVYLSVKANKLRKICMNDYINKLDYSLIPFINWCPAHFANSNSGDHTRIPDDVLENARMKREAIEEILRETEEGR